MRPFVKIEDGPKRKRISAAPKSSSRSVVMITESAERSVTIALDIKFATCAIWKKQQVIDAIKS